MARFEAALAHAGASAGFFAPTHAQAIAAVCAQPAFDAAALAREARTAGTLAIPFVRALTAAVEQRCPQAARFVHFGATSQDAIDTATALCLKEAAKRVDALAVRVGDAAAELARRHLDTPTVARTLLQPALPVPFGWKAALWLLPLTRSLGHFRRAAGEACVLQLGGAAGTLSAFRGRGQEVSAAVAAALGLTYAVPWHGARDAFARLGSELAVLAGCAAKVARDVALLMQPEVGEAAEPSTPGRGGSSSMPHKRNPAGCLLALEAAGRTPGLAATLLGALGPEHERGLGQWQSQWFTLRELTGAAGSALAAMAEVLEGLVLDVAAMRANLARSRGLVYSEAVALRLSRATADRLCVRATRDGAELRDVMRADAEVAGSVTPQELESLFEPAGSYGSARDLTERMLADWARARETSA